MSLLERILSGEKRALARALSLVENDGPSAGELLNGLLPYAGRAHVVGITGAPGTGKSTLVSALAHALRQSGHTVGIIAVDPTSPLTGGALLGDRIRMRDLAGDPGVFVRSMASRGGPGGLARATRDAVAVLDAAGYQFVLVETVGAGQTDVAIADQAHTIVVLQTPNSGDGIQALKAGLLEIADILVVNKADQAGADQAVAQLESMLSLGSTQPPGADSAAQWRPPVLRTIATQGDGIPALISAIEGHRVHHRPDTATWIPAKQRSLRELRSAIRDRLWQQFERRIPPERLEELATSIARHQIDPAGAAERLLREAGDLFSPITHPSTEEES